MPQRPARIRKVMIVRLALCCGLFVSQLSIAMEAYIGSDADGVHTLYKISFTGADDVALVPCVQFSRAVGPYETAMIAMRPDKPVCYLFIGPQIVSFNLETKTLERRRVPGRDVAYFAAPAFFSPTGRRLYVFSVGGENTAGFVLNSDSLEVVGELPYRGQLGSVYAVAFTPDESALRVARGSSIVRYPMPTGGALRFGTVSEEVTTFAEVSSGAPERLYLQGGSLLAVGTSSNEEGVPISTDLTKLTAGDQVRRELGGMFLPGCERDSPLCSFDPGTETIHVYDAAGTLGKKISVVFTELLTESEVEVAYDDTGKAFKKLVGARTYGGRSPRFQTGHMSPDGRFAAMVFDNGVRGPSYVSIVDISAGTVSPALRVGEVDGGVSNVVFRNAEE